VNALDEPRTISNYQVRKDLESRAKRGKRSFESCFLVDYANSTNCLIPVDSSTLCLSSSIHRDRYQSPSLSLIVLTAPLCLSPKFSRSSIPFSLKLIPPSTSHHIPIHLLFHNTLRLFPLPSSSRAFLLVFPTRFSKPPSNLDSTPQFRGQYW